MLSHLMLLMTISILSIQHAGPPLVVLWHAHKYEADKHWTEACVSGSVGDS